MCYHTGMWKISLIEAEDYIVPVSYAHDYELEYYVRAATKMIKDGKAKALAIEHSDYTVRMEIPRD